MGISLAAQLRTSWDASRLEQLVAGPSITGPGKRADALLETSGRIRALVFAEIKHHRTDLLASEYRSGCWSPSAELTGAVVQAQQTVDIAVRAIGAQLRDRDEERAETGEAVHVVRPRSFVVAGQPDELRGASGVHTAKYRSFELYGRNLYEPKAGARPARAVVANEHHERDDDTPDRHADARSLRYLTFPSSLPSARPPDSSSAATTTTR